MIRLIAIGFVIWLLSFGVSCDGKNHRVGCSVERGVEIHTTHVSQ